MPLLEVVCILNQNFKCDEGQSLAFLSIKKATMIPLLLLGY
jgi:hypothetical protein